MVPILDCRRLDDLEMATDRIGRLFGKNEARADDIPIVQTGADIIEGMERYRNRGRSECGHVAKLGRHVDDDELATWIVHASTGAQ